MLYIRLFHGRTDPNQEMDDWGSDGPLFGPYKFVHITYKNYIRLSRPDDKCDELFLAGDMLFYDGVYYGDWSILSLEVFRESRLGITFFEQEKANLPKNKS